MKPSHTLPKALFTLFLCLGALAACGDSQAGVTGRLSDTDALDGSGLDVPTDAATNGSADTDADDTTHDSGDADDAAEPDIADNNDTADDDAVLAPDTDDTTDIADEPLPPPPCSSCLSC